MSVLCVFDKKLWTASIEIFRKLDFSLARTGVEIVRLTSCLKYPKQKSEFDICLWMNKSKNWDLYRGWIFDMMNATNCEIYVPIVTFCANVNCAFDKCFCWKWNMFNELVLMYDGMILPLIIFAVVALFRTSFISYFDFCSCIFVASCVCARMNTPFITEVFLEILPPFSCIPK